MMVVPEAGRISAASRLLAAGAASMLS